MNTPRVHQIGSIEWYGIHKKKSIDDVSHYTVQETQNHTGWNFALKT